MEIGEDIKDLLYNDKYIDHDVNNECISKVYGDKITNIFYQMKQITEKQLKLIDTITTIQNNSVNQFNMITNRITHLENAVSSLVTNNLYYHKTIIILLI